MGTKCTEQEDQFIRDPFNCSVFYQCDNGYPRKKECPSGLCFDISTTLCDFCENVVECKCWYYSRSTTAMSGTTEGFEEEFDKCFTCPLGIKRSIFCSHPKDCAKFYFCKKGKLKGDMGICAKGLWFSVMDDKCVEPWQDTCYLNMN